MNISEIVGWEPRNLRWPTYDEVMQADEVQLLEWYRFLPVAETEKELTIINTIIELM